MAIFAHPDDEGAIAGTLAHYARNDAEIMLVCATRGEAGEISDPALATPENLGQVRQKELEEACRIIGIQHLEFLDYRDSGMEGTAENEDPRALIRADTVKFRAEIVSLIRQFLPEVVITFEPFGWYGHPDHKFVSKWVTEAFPLADDPAVDPEVRPAWQPRRLFHSVMPISKFRGMIEKGIEGGYIEESEFGDDIPVEQQLETEARVTHVLDVRKYFGTRMASMMVHRTQFGKDNFFRKLPDEMVLEATGKEYFIQVSPDLSPELTKKPLTDLFEES